MSTLSEALRAASEKVSARTNDDDSTFVDVTASDSPVRDVPYMDEMKDFYEEQILKAVRRIYRRNAGSKEFESPLDAMERTVDQMLFGMLPIAINALSDGVQFGQQKSSTYKKFAFMKRLQDLFDNESFRHESSMFSLRVADDPESKTFVQDYLVGTIRCLGSATGYSRTHGDAVNKIWDLWIVSMKSVIIAMYTVGHELGHGWAEEDVLQGILQASMVDDE